MESESSQHPRERYWLPLSLFTSLFRMSVSGNPRRFVPLTPAALEVRDPSCQFGGRRTTVDSELNRIENLGGTEEDRLERLKILAREVANIRAFANEGLWRVWDVVQQFNLAQQAVADPAGAFWRDVQRRAEARQRQREQWSEEYSQLMDAQWMSGAFLRSCTTTNTG